MSHFAVGLKQVYGGLKTMFGYGAKNVAQQGTRQTARYTGPTLSEMCARQPLALPAPTELS